ncbi:TonB-dependent receptor plug domain-containing protein [Acinetobacter indicus]|uniref:TonB-dependent receptor plug domain-containing protein n=1 Tax=Acinetobacter indicus TaxID=756892 RepID=UPI000948C38A|nr:TonB-dependent receptor [Acinetobacter indicus]
MSIQFQPTALVGAIALAMGFSTSVFATESQEQPAVNAALDTLVVTATRSEEKIENVPARISIIEPAKLEQSPIASLPHLLFKDASINLVQTGGYGQQASIFLRGTESDHTLIMRDGVRLNTPSQGSASIQFIDTTDLKQIEVLKGPASVLYGTDAIGGVIQLVSKTPEKSGAFLTGEVGENSTYKSIIGADFAEDGFYTQIRGQRLESDGDVILNNDKRKYSYDQKGYSAKVGLEKERFATSLDYSQNSGNGAYKLNGNLVSQDFQNEIINLKGKVQITSNLELNARLSQFKDDLDQLDKPDFIHNSAQEAELYSKWQFTPTQNLLAGLTHKKMKADIFSQGESFEWDGIFYPGEDVFYDKEIKSTGYFAQHQYQTDKVQTQVGVRVEDNQRFGSHTVGQAAIRYHFNPFTSVYSNIGSSFRAPSMNDLYALSWGGNPELKPEEGFAYELGLDQKLTENSTLGLSIYRNEIDNLITSKAGKLVNVNKSEFTGGELSYKWNADDLFLTASYAYVQAKDAELKEDLQKRPRQKVTLSTGIQNAIYGVSASVVGSSKSKSWDSRYQNPGYATIDLNAYWNITPSVKVFTNIENIGDVQYETEYFGGDSIYYINGGRLASAGVTFKY